MPIRIKNIPPNKDTIFKYLLIFGKYLKIKPKPRAIIIKGTASPAEKTASKKTPCQTVVVLALSSRTLPKMGPMQGVQPKAKVAPKIKALKGWPGFNLFKT